MAAPAATSASIAADAMTLLSRILFCRLRREAAAEVV
jgi:hypothetical protein